MTEEVIAENSFETIEKTIAITTKWYEGDMQSTMVGPAKSWDSIKWAVNLSEVPENDTSYLDVFGINSSGGLELIIEKSTEKKLDISTIDPQQYEKIVLKFYTKDELTLSSADLDYWRVLYEGVPEATLNLSSDYNFYSDTLEQGEILTLKMYANNISIYDMDSLLVRYILTDENNKNIIIEETIAPLIQNDSLVLSFQYNTTDLNGTYQLSIEINPDKDQKECFYFNNLGLLYFTISEDRRNPVLDVTFDGIHIIDGDIVSAKPRIDIDLTDENPYLLIQDTSEMDVFLKYPDGTLRQIPLSNPEIEFYPAEDENNHAKIIFLPSFEEDGTYELQVLAKDVSGNISGTQKFIVSFQVILNESISNVLNYPNPFSTSTQFVFTLTGTEIPEYLKIQIMNVSGQVVREILKEELGPLKIGLNRTEYTWNGTDEFGGKLANGVYLYRIVSKDIEGELYDNYETGTEKYFKNNLGKMVILR